MLASKSEVCRRNIMKYERPHVLTVKSALEMIATVQVDKATYLVVERDPSSSRFSAGTYEADE
jgi:hypothetical protein